MKFYMVVNFYPVSLSFKFYEDPFINARARVENVRMSIYNSYVQICALIIMQFKTYALMIVIDHHIKFHKDQSFGCGDICKTKQTLVQPFIFYVFCIFSKFV